MICSKPKAFMLVSALAVIAACGNSNTPSGSGHGGSAGTAGTSGDSGSGGDAGSAGTLIPIDDGGQQDTGSGQCPYTDPNDTTDHDGDGWSNADGDCNDCDPTINPGAFDGIDPDDAGQIDNDCDGNINNDAVPCDTGIAIDDNIGMNGAKAIALCRVADPNATGKNKTWGVISANYVMANGSNGMNALSHGVVPNFGAANVQEGVNMLALSSGIARAANQTGFVSPSGNDMGTTGACPTGYPKASQTCNIAGKICNDQAALELQIRVPTNAQSFSFNLLFYTYEFPDYICSDYNDFYITWMDPKPTGVADNNISFDQDGNAVSVNASFLQVCKGPCNAGGKHFTCPLGPALLAGTGFEETDDDGPHAATGWLQTTAPVIPGSTITLRFAIWDTTDHILDSTVLIDNFQWALKPSTPQTTPVPTPK